MNDKLLKYLDCAFSPYEELQTLRDLKEELNVILQDKLSDFKNQGYDEVIAYRMTIDSIGDIKEIIESISDKTKELKQMVRNDLSMSNLKDSDLKGITVNDGKFDASDLRGSDLSTSGLSHSSYKCSDLRNVKFDGADLTGAVYNMSDLNNVSLDGANLAGAKFIMSDIRGVCFDGANLAGAKFDMSDIRNTGFKNCILDNTEFNTCDLSGVCFDNLVFNNTIFNKTALTRTSFRNAVLRNVTFKGCFKSYFKINAEKTIFDGATMDKLTYAVLKGAKADLSNVTVI